MAAFYTRGGLTFTNPGTEIQELSGKKTQRRFHPEPPLCCLCMLKERETMCLRPFSLQATCGIFRFPSWQ